MTHHVLEALLMYDPNSSYESQYPEFYLTNPQTETEWYYIGNVTDKLDDEMKRMLSHGAVIAGGAALALVNGHDYGDVDYYVKEGDWTRICNLLSKDRVLVNQSLDADYGLVYTYGKDGAVATKYRAPALGYDPWECTVQLTLVPYPKAYRPVVGLNVESFAKNLGIDVGQYTPPPKDPGGIDVIMARSDFRKHIARSFDLTVCKTYVDDEGDVYSMFPDDIRKRRVAHSLCASSYKDFSRMLHRQEKYISRGYTYYEKSCLHKFAVPSWEDFPLGYTDDPKAGRFMLRILNYCEHLNGGPVMTTRVSDLSSKCAENELFEMLCRIVHSHTKDGLFEYGGMTLPFEVEKSDIVDRPPPTPGVIRLYEAAYKVYVKRKNPDTHWI